MRTVVDCAADVAMRSLSGGCCLSVRTYGLSGLGGMFSRRAAPIHCWAMMVVVGADASLPCGCSPVSFLPPFFLMSVLPLYVCLPMYTCLSAFSLATVPVSVSLWLVLHFTLNVLRCCAHTLHAFSPTPV